MKEVLQTGMPDLDFRSGETEGLVPGEPKISGAEEGIPYVMTKEELDKFIEGHLPKWVEEVEKTLRKHRTRDPKLV